MELQKAKDWADLTLKTLSSAAIVVAGLWAGGKFLITDEAASNIQVDVSTEVLSNTTDSRLLVVHFKMKNIGKVPVEPEHLKVTVRDIPEGLKPGDSIYPSSRSTTPRMLENDTQTDIYLSRA